MNLYSQTLAAAAHSQTLAAAAHSQTLAAAAHSQTFAAAARLSKKIAADNRQQLQFMSPEEKRNETNC